MKLNEIILNYRKQNDLSQRQFAQLCGLSNGYVAMIEKGGNNPATGKPINLSLGVLKQISDGIGISLDDLLHQLDGSQIVSLDSTPQNLPDLPNIIPITTRKIPLLGTIACGEPIMTDAPFEAYVELGSDVNADFALRASGDSMTGARILDGDIVFIRRQPTVDDGEIAAVLIDGEATLKRVRHAGTDLVLWPENPAYQPIIVPAGSAKDIRVLGKAVAFQSDVH